ncbi:MAG: SURF1 family protein [Pseudorhodoplanes sp.]|nr:SURF1 family protein [Pseudorhodoplanes sp.]
MTTASGAGQGSERRGLLVPSIMAVAGLAILIGLGLWQLERKTWKEGLIATVTERAATVPTELPPQASWNALDPAGSEFRRVRMRVDFPRDARPAWLYVSGSALRDDIKSPGYFVFSPARLPDGRIVAVNRGYVRDRDVAPVSGPGEIVGYLRWPEKPSWFVSAHDSTGDVWFVRDPALMAKVLGWGEVAPFYIDQEGPLPAAGQPRPGPLKVGLRNDHLNYALTWFSLAAALLGVFSLWLWKRARTRPTGSSL